MKKVYIVTDLIEHWEDVVYDEFNILNVFDSEKKAIDYIENKLLDSEHILWHDDETKEYITSNISMTIKRTVTIREFEVH